MPTGSTPDSYAICLSAEALGHAVFVGGAEHDEHEDRGHDDLDDRDRQQVEPARRVVAEAVGREPGILGRATGSRRCPTGSGQ
jgi:hypothetical protein